MQRAEFGRVDPQCKPSGFGEYSKVRPKSPSFHNQLIDVLQRSLGGTERLACYNWYTYERAEMGITRSLVYVVYLTVL